MADNKQQIIIIKRKKAGGHGHHGGAWKVAYADFVTAMMCFFLVMWLMGSDDETKAAVAHYFNHPNTPYKSGRDPQSDVAHPLGEQEGHGDSVANGHLGLWPEDLLERPRPQKDLMKENQTLSKLIEDLLEGHIYGMDVTKEYVKFSIPDDVQFETGSAELTPKAKETLDLLGNVLKTFTGYLTIAGHTDENPIKGGKFQSNWDLSFGRARAVMNYLVAKHGLDEGRIQPQAFANRKPSTSSTDPEARKRNRRVEFTLSYDGEK